MRVGIISIYHESNTFMSQPTTLEDYKRQLLLCGDQEIREKFTFEHHEVSGFFKGLKDAGIETVGVFIAWTIPSGTITDECLRTLLDMLTAELDKAGKLDGLMVAPHGAAASEKVRDVDGHWLSLVRQRVGPNMPIIGTCDPHVNLSQKMIDATDALVAYRTNPHLDQFQRGLEAAKLMARTLKGEIKPTQAVALPAIAINIERQLTSAMPCQILYQRADEILTRPKVLSDSITLGFPYADVEEMGSAFIVVTDNDKALAQKYADELAALLTSHRDKFVAELISVDDAVARAAKSEPPVCLLDMGDNVGGGSPGDGTLLAHALHRANLRRSFICIYDPESQQTARIAGVGKRLTLTMGGKSDNRHGPPFTAEVKVLSVHEGKFTEPEIRHGGIKEFNMGETAIVETDSGLTIQLTSLRMFPVSLVQLTSCGLKVEDFRAIVAKGVHAPVGAYGKACKTMIRVNTPGITTADMTALEYKHRRTPLFPFER